MPTWQYYNATGFSGTIDDIGLWNRVISQEEVTLLYEAPSSTISVNDDECDFKIFPNPASSFLTLRSKGCSSKGIYTLKIENSLGQTCLVFSVDKKEMVVELPELPAGAYPVFIFDGKGNIVAAEKLILGK